MYIYKYMDCPDGSNCCRYSVLEDDKACSLDDAVCEESSVHRFWSRQLDAAIGERIANGIWRYVGSCRSHFCECEL